jgi:hypothetical protein
MRRWRRWRCRDFAYGFGEGIVQTVAQAVERIKAQEAVWAERRGQRLWLRSLPMEYPSEIDNTFSYLIALDEQPSCMFGLRYRGRLDDLVPDDFTDFTVYVDGGKYDDVFGEDFFGEVPVAEAEPSSAPTQDVRAEDGTLLKYVTRIDTPEAAAEWFARPDVYVRCDSCFGIDNPVVRVGDPDGECSGQHFSHDDEGRLEWDEEFWHTFPAVYLAA